MKMTFNGLELAQMDIGEFTERVGNFIYDSGIAFVTSGKIEEVRVPETDTIEVRAYFDSSYWTGRKG